MELDFHISCKKKIEKYQEVRYVFRTENYSSKKHKQQTKLNWILKI
jgi:hypothetical protein